MKSEVGNVCITQWWIQEGATGVFPPPKQDAILCFHIYFCCVEVGAPQWEILDLQLSLVQMFDKYNNAVFP